MLKWGNDFVWTSLLEYTLKAARQKQRYVTLLHPKHWDRVAAVHSRGGVRLVSFNEGIMRFSVVSGTKSGVSYTVNLRFRNPKETLKALLKKTKRTTSTDLLLAEKFRENAAIELNCNCFTGDTKVPLLDGTTLSMKELHEKYGTGNPFWVYASDESGEFVPARAVSLGVTGERADLVKVTLDNGEFAVCTQDHLWRLRDGTYRKAGELKEGDSLLPLYRAEYRKGYECVRNNITGKGYPTYWKVAESVLGLDRKVTKVHIHHADRDKSNNTPENLRLLSADEHRKEHQKDVVVYNVRNWATPGYREKASARLTGRKMPESGKAAMREAWTPRRRAVRAELTRAENVKRGSVKNLHTEDAAKARVAGLNRPEVLQRRSDDMKRRAESPEWRKHLSEISKRAWTVERKEAHRAALQAWWTPERRAERAREQSQCKWSPATLASAKEKRLAWWTPERRTAVGGRSSSYWSDPDKKARMREEVKAAKSRMSAEALSAGGKATGRKWLDPAYRIAHIEGSRASLAKAREVLNAQRKDSRSALHGEVDNNVELPEVGAHNHKVTSVEVLSCGSPVPVYDLSVEKYHNFAIAAGVYVHNCPANLYWGGAYIQTKKSAKYGEKENRPPNIRNPRQYGFTCKHGSEVMNELPQYDDDIILWLNELVPPTPVPPKQPVAPTPAAELNKPQPKEEPVTEPSTTEEPVTEQPVKDQSTQEGPVAAPPKQTVVPTPVAAEPVAPELNPGLAPEEAPAEEEQIQAPPRQVVTPSPVAQVPQFRPMPRKIKSVLR